MRPIANFTFHAILAAAIAALATTSAAAGEPTEHFFTITIQEGRLGATQPGGTQAYVGRNDGRVQQIQVSSWEWGAADASKVDSFTVKQGVRPVASTGGGGVTVAAGDVDGDSRAAGKKPTSSQSTLAPGATKPTASGQATGKRQHMPLRTRAYYDSPPPKGSLRVKVKFPWSACEVGRKYPSLELAGGDKRYLLEDVAVSNCGGAAAGEDVRELQEVTLTYQKIQVRGWDPQKKEN
jgi:hypothetical protein